MVVVFHFQQLLDPEGVGVIPLDKVERILNACGLTNITDKDREVIMKSVQMEFPAPPGSRPAIDLQHWCKVFLF